MNLTELLEEIAVLPQEKIPVVRAALDRRVQEDADSSLRPDFEELANRVFTKHEEVLARLAQ